MYLILSNYYSLSYIFPSFITEAWHRSSLKMRWRYFFEGAELSIMQSRLSLSELFHLCIHLLLSWSEYNWCRAERLSSKHLHKIVWRKLALLEGPWAVDLASSSACSLGSKSLCPSTQCNWRSIMSLWSPFQGSPAFHNLISWQLKLCRRFSPVSSPNSSAL